MNGSTWMKRVSGFLMIAATAVVFAPSAEAGTNPATVNVSATVTSACTLTGGPLAFGNYVAGQAASLSTTMGDTVKCGAINASNPDTASITLTSTANPVVGGYQMLNGANTLNYSVAITFASGGGAQPVIPGGSATFTLTGNDAFTITGTIAGGLNVATGTYSDTLSETVNY